MKQTDMIPRCLNPYPYTSGRKPTQTKKTGNGLFYMFGSSPSAGNFRYTLKYIPRKHAVPPTRLEIASAMYTPLTPKPILGSNTVSGTTMMTLRNKEKKIALFVHLKAVKVDCPALCPAMKANAKK